MWKTCGAIALVLFAFASFATAPRLDSVMPAGVRRGTEVQFSFKGERLGDTQEIICYESGVTVRRLNQVTSNLVKATVSIEPECSLGEHHLRVRTASGISELRTFFVSPYPVVSEVEPNNLPAQAQKIALNSTVAGVITSEDVDCFSVALKKGELLSAEVEGMRLGRSMFDPRLAVMETNGTVLSDVDDTWLATQDPFISLVAPHDGTYIIQLRESTYGGGADFHYLLHIGNFPRPTSVYPLGGKAGENTVFTFYSDASGDFIQDMKLPPAPQEKFGVFAEKDKLAAPSPNWIRVSEFPNVLASGKISDRARAIEVNFPPPFALNGIISLAGEEDWFKFPATKGVPLEVNVYARQLRSPLDSVLEIVDSKGKSVASNDDANGGADSALKFTPAATTNYFVAIRDTLGHFGRDFTYRIEVTPAKARINVKIPEVSRNDTQARQYIAVPRGNRFATLLSAKRENFSGELRLSMGELPPGVTLEADTLPGNVDAAPVVFEAAPDAAISGKLLNLIASGTNAGGAVAGHFHQDIELVQGPNNTSYYGTSVDKLCVAVVKEAPFRIHFVEPKVPLVQAGSMALQVFAERKRGFDEPIVLSMLWNPPGVTSQHEATIARGATNVSYQLNAAEAAEVRKWKIALLAHARVDGGEVYVSSQLGSIEITSPFLSGKIQTLAASPGKKAVLNVELQQLKPFDGKAKIHLMGLPDSIKTTEKEITKGDKKISFDLDVGAKCALGPVKNLFCSADIAQNGLVIPQTLASGGLLRIVPAKPEPTMVAQAKEAKK